MNPPPVMVVHGDRAETPARCPVRWCVSLHDPDDDLHFGGSGEFVVLTSPYSAVPIRRETMSVSLEQVKHNAPLMIALDASTGPVYLTREDARRLAIKLLQLDLDANGVDGA